jgi:hypothetical protein
MSDDLSQMMDKPGAVMDNALNAMTKKAASTFWGKFKKQLSTASEPLFRKDMGERYLPAGNLQCGCLIWILATAIALCFPSCRSAAAILCKALHWGSLASVFQFWLFTLATGAMLASANFAYGNESIALMAKYRADGTAYHTMSRGIPRWGENQTLVAIGITAVLFLFDLPAGILFLASCGMSAKLAAEQQAAIYARYLDALDAKIEQEYLESAILGQCPTEITQLHKPLPPDMNADLRANIAAAAVGKPAKIVAKAPKPKVQTLA